MKVLYHCNVFYTFIILYIVTQVLEDELHLPFSLVSGHIHELQVQR